MNCSASDGGDEYLLKYNQYSSNVLNTTKVCRILNRLLFLICKLLFNLFFLKVKLYTI